MILLPARGFLAVEVEDHVIHLLADTGIVSQHLVTETCGRAIRKFFPHTLEKGFGIGKLLCIAVGMSVCLSFQELYRASDTARQN